MTETEARPCDNCGVPVIECPGCSTCGDDVGIVLMEPVDFRVRRACGGQVQACCSECHLALTYWYHLGHQDHNRPAAQAEIDEYLSFLDRLRTDNPERYPVIEEEFRRSLAELGSLPEGWADPDQE